MPRGLSSQPLPTFGDEEIVDISRQYPMYVMPIEAVLKLERIPTHEEAFAQLIEWEPSMGDAMFVSHTWLTFKHPDNSANIKLRTLQGLLRNCVAGKLKVPPNVFTAALAGLSAIPAKRMSQCKFVWLDFFSVPQADQEQQMLAIRSIFSYVQVSAHFLVLAGPWAHEDGSSRDDFAWATRGWCRLESLANRLSKADTPYLLARSSSSIETHGDPGICCVVQGHWYNGMVVGEGCFSVETDKVALGPIIKAMLAGRMKLALEDGDLHFYRLLYSLAHKVLHGTGASFKQPATLDEWMGAMRMTSPREGEKTGWTPLRYACFTGRLDLCEQLIARGAKVNVYLKRQCTYTFMLASQNISHTTTWAVDYPDITRLLIRHGADPWEPSPSFQTGDTPAITAMLGESPATLEMLATEVSAEVLTRPGQNGKKMTSMMGYARPEMMRFLLGTTEAPSKYREQLLAEVAGKGNYDKAWGVSFANPASAGHLETLRVLLDSGVDPEVHELTALRGVFRLFRWISNWKVLHTHAPKPSLLTLFAFSLNGICLHAAAFHGRLPCVNLLLERGSNVNEQAAHTTRMSPLMTAAVNGHDVVIDVLLAAGADPNLTDKRKRTAAKWARAYGHVALAQKLELLMTPGGSSRGAKKYRVAPSPETHAVEKIP